MDNMPRKSTNEVNQRAQIIAKQEMREKLI